MSKVRRDNKGRVLRQGESQRKDSLYQYRYTDCFGKRHTVYAPTLKELREKEEEIHNAEKKGVNYAAGKATVYETFERFISLKNGIKYNTLDNYEWILRAIKSEPFVRRPISEIRISDAKAFILKLYNDGRAKSTVIGTKRSLRSVFQMAYEEDIIVRNPFTFKITDVVPCRYSTRESLSENDKNAWLDFVENDPQFAKYYDEIIVLLGTGLRVSEFCGLTRSDLDFENRRISVTHQLLEKNDGTLYIHETKTKSGRRYVPMSDEVYRSLKNILVKRGFPKKETVVDGYSGFLLINRFGVPKVARCIQHYIRKSVKVYNSLYPDTPLPRITPHVLRHTFCTEMYYSGLDLKSLQYIMGHANPSITTGIYTHAGYEQAAEQMAKVLGFRRAN